MSSSEPVAEESPFVTSIEVAFMRALGARDPAVRGPDVPAHPAGVGNFRVIHARLPG